MMKRVLISPLNWGLGHATRMVPVVKQCLKLNVEVTIGGNGASFEFLKQTFPHLKHVHIPGVEVWFGNRRWINYLGMLFQAPYFLWKTVLEKRWLAAHQTDFDVVISDNRYGLSHPSLSCIMVTHQTVPPVPFFKKISKRIIAKFLNTFQEIWVPDHEQFQLTQAFRLLNKTRTPFQLIGWLSSWETTPMLSKGYWAVLASGPEPGKTRFVDLIQSKIKCPLVICDGDSGESFMQVIEGAEGIIAKCGYSTIMDVLLSEKKALLIPTPGQKEQEILGNHNWLKTQLKILSYQELVSASQINLDTVPTPRNIEQRNMLHQCLINLLQ